MSDYLSWGGYPRVSQKVIDVDWLFELPELVSGNLYLGRGLGRSYGDSCLNADNFLLSTLRLDRLISFDQESAILRCESGTSLKQILEFAVPRGYFLPVSPGTKFVSIGGAIANDIHGKNHHRAGTFGRHIEKLCLLRSNGEQLLCSASENNELFRATIGGLGLTGLILWADLKLKAVSSAMIEMESIKFSSLDEFFEICNESDSEFDYTVSWLDCVAADSNFGRGIFMRAHEAGREHFEKGLKLPSQRFSIPFNFPDFALNPLSVSLFNALYYGKQRMKNVSRLVHYEPFFYPLDGVLNWNRIYGKRGFLQFQCVVPEVQNNAPIRAILRAIVESGQASFLAVLKRFGDIKSPGMLSFPRPGLTLCLDFPMRGERTLKLFERLDRLVAEFDGAIYPAKDACMSKKSFEQYFPGLIEFEKYIDPCFSSSFWRRVRAI